MKNILRITITTLGLYCSFFSFAVAEITADVVLEPENPSPKSNVTLRLESYSFDVNTAMISWQIGGKTIKSGQGEKSLTIKVGDVGDQTVVTVTAETADGSSIKQAITVSPSSVILLYEAPKSYVPLLYEGRSLPSDGALVRVTAIPQISDGRGAASPSTLSYTWYMNDSVIKEASGLGKQTAVVYLDFLNNKDDIKVIVRSARGNSATKTITIYPHRILPLVYTYDQILGPNFSTLIERRFEAVKDFTLNLQPLYISTGESKEPTYIWFLDGLPSTPLGGRTLSLHPKENSYGTKMLSISLTGPDKRIQKSSTKMELIFDTRK